MDPNLFRVDWKGLFEVVVALVVVSFLFEQALAFLCETRAYNNLVQGKSFKKIIAFVVEASVCWFWDFDVFSMIFLKEEVTFPGAVITGALLLEGTGHL